MKNTFGNIVKIALPLLLGGAILYWMYRGIDFGRAEHILLHEMNWTWMLLSFPFGIMAQVFRGWRWKQTLEPTGEKPRTGTSIYSIFVSYASSLVIPRIGEFMRCGILKRYDGVAFSKALGTVVTERAIDSLVVAIMTALTLLLQMSIFGTFFQKTGTNIEGILSRFTTTGYIVTLICGIAIVMLLYFLLRRLSIYNKVKTTMKGIWQGITSLKDVRNKWLFWAYSLGIWVSYFLHFYLTFYCFSYTEHLGPMAALVAFVVGTFAVIVPTPNGAGPWHFAVKTVLMLYGVDGNDGAMFVLIVHTLQTALVALLGIWAAVWAIGSDKK